ncbi:hypothetical protein V2A60_001959 [Cordyceps javanica]|uniref:Hydrophobin n=1 Tax=Cordyceps javanica TaxID=43265 RepID=A0A545VGR7_9HYPO|nr:fungal hydrophobin domain-containing protein [Cordyceps javanica]TQW12095.1 fungal hydrophobin domain-containing protein [Cordyceps javanica]
MRFALAAITTFVAAVAAVPHHPPAHHPPNVDITHKGDIDVTHKTSQLTVGDAGDKCGANQELYCCDETKTTPGAGSDGGLGGLIGAVVGGDGVLTHLLGECSKINVDLLIGVSDLLHSQCTAKAACCHNTPSVASNGLVNLALPCIPIAGLLG